VLSAMLNRPCSLRHNHNHRPTKSMGLANFDCRPLQKLNPLNNCTKVHVIIRLAERRESMLIEELNGIIHLAAVALNANRRIERDYSFGGCRGINCICSFNTKLESFFNFNLSGGR